MDARVIHLADRAVDGAPIDDSDPVGMPTLREIAETWPATVSVSRAALAFGLSRSHAYDAASRGEFPARVIKVGGRYRVVTASIVRVLSDDPNQPVKATAAPPVGTRNAA